jgi:very-short-patch-repair endonuclease
MDIAAHVDALGGFAQKRQLVARGARDLDLTRAVRGGTVRRARQGWYTTLPERDPRVRAVRVGGRLTGLSAIAALGGWVLRAPLLHVAVPPNAARLRSASNRFAHPPARRIRGVRLRWDVGRGGDVSMVGLIEALRRVVLDESRETAIAALDWALHTGRVDEMDVASIMLAVPARHRIPWAALDPLCESLPESLARTRLRDAGFSVRSQVALPNGQRIDLLVDEIVGLETDGEAFHADRFAEDRAKDGLIIRQNYVPYRVPATTVFRAWDEVVATVEAAILARRFGNSGVAEPQRPRKRLRRTIGTATPEFPKRTGMRVGGAGLLSG